ncbi:hypothetical protein PENFLA_c014G03125 [Penicillium flavigenum]|uniref:Uncharacterized protein n=1 Tax=Penicillium flavigenum TaxID=254877 RepID=A0A1V6T5Z8_9EURO|nr:hypothetical protein PENFLA_c014G03125 [Penicillium flavigenum]
MGCSQVRPCSAGAPASGTIILRIEKSSAKKLWAWDMLEHAMSSAREVVNLDLGVGPTFDRRLTILGRSVCTTFCHTCHERKQLLE